MKKCLKKDHVKKRSSKKDNTNTRKISNPKIWVPIILSLVKSKAKKI